MSLQVGLSLPLLMASLAMVENLRLIGRFPLGFQPKDLRVWRVTFPRMGPDPTGRSHRIAEGLARVEALPGVAKVGLVSELPFSDSSTSGTFVLLGRDLGQEPRSDLRVVAGEYFETLGIPLVAGRFFRASEDRSSVPVAIVSQTLVARYFPDGHPLGQRILVGSPDERALYGGPVEREIVGVVGDVAHGGLSGDKPPVLYLPYSQSPAATITLVARDPLGRAEAARAFLGEYRDFTVAAPSTMEAVISRSLGYPGLQTGIVGSLAVVAMLLIGVSMVAVISDFLTHRQHSLAVRMALGAERSTIVNEVLRHAAWLWVGGFLGGLVASLWVTRILANYIQLARSPSLASLGVAAAIVVLLTLGAIFIPFRRILTQEPGPLLRSE